MIPGMNLLGMALSIIAQQPVMYYRYTGRSINDAGEYVSAFADPVEIEGCSVQAVDRSKYEEMGLDVTKKYYTWFAPTDIQDPGRDISGDQLEWGGMRLEVQGQTPWYSLDGWDNALVMYVGPPTNA